MCKGLWYSGFIFFITSCGSLSTTRSENESVIKKVFSVDLLENIYTQCFLTPFKPHLYFEGAFRFEIFLSKDETKRYLRITHPFHPPIDNCAQNLIEKKLQYLFYPGPDLIIKESFYFSWPEID